MKFRENSKFVVSVFAVGSCAYDQTMTEAEHNRPIPKLFSNRPSASAAEFGLLREPIIFFENNM